MGWRTDEFGASHEGFAGAVTADGVEPKPVYLDVGSGPTMHKTAEWWAYDGQLSRSKASHLRASCTCGWRSAEAYPIDWELVAENGTSSVDTDSAYEDWVVHISAGEDRSLPLPADLEDLLQRLDERLEALAGDAPLATLRAVAAVERTTLRIARAASASAQAEAAADEVSWRAIGEALGLTEREARARLTHYAFRR